MANYNNLKAGIDAVIKTNGRQEISGAALNTQLKNMIAELGAGYQYMGVATPATNPGTPDANVFYLASKAGTYTDFGGIVINEGEVCALVWNGTWTKQVTGAATAAQVNQLGQLAQKINNTILCVFDQKDVINGKYINASGLISNATQDYHLVKIYLDAGDYVISTTGTTYINLAKYTDDSYSTFERAYLNMQFPYTGKLTLPAGYYAFSWLDGRSELKENFISNSPELLSLYKNISDITELNTGLTKINSEIRQTAQSLFSLSDIVTGKYINLDGSIADGVSSYHLVKFDITTEGDYVISTGGSARPILAKFSNADYSGNGTILISHHIYDVFQKIHLATGHYAMSWDGDGTIKDNYISNSPALLAIFKEPIGLKNNAFVALGIGDVAVMGTSSKSGKVITLNGGGYANRAYLNKKFECAKKQVGATFKTSGTPDILIGFVNGEYLHIWNENGVCVSELYYSNGTPVETTTKQEYGFALQSDVAYQVVVSFDDADAYASMSISITDEYGNSESHSWDLLIDPAFNGAIYFASASVTSLTNPVITNQHYYDVRNVKAAIFGHSFVEAWTLRPQRQNAFADLIGQAIGRDVFMIYGLGGDTVSGVSQNIQTCKDFIANAEYVLLCVGRNDGNLTAQDFETAILSVIVNLEDMNIVPILFTIEPDANGYASQAFPTINEWIRNSGYHYVDMDRVFHNPDGTINTTLYIGDGTHPNAEGHLRIFNRVKFDCPFLF